MTSAAEWTKRVGAWRKSGLSAGAFCEGRGFAASTLRYWAWRVEKKPVETRPSAAEPTRDAPPQFVRVARVPASSAGGVTIEVNGARVSVPAGVDRATLSAVLAALADAVRTP